MAIFCFPMVLTSCYNKAESLDNFQEVTVTPTYVYDGDTVYLEDAHLIENPFDPTIEVETRIRFLGIDAPEINNDDSNTLQEIWAVKARGFVETNITSMLDVHVVDVDIYNRAIVIPTIETKDISIELLKNGLAREVFSDYPKPSLWITQNHYYSEELINAQEHAMENSLGIWSLTDSELLEVFPN